MRRVCAALLAVALLLGAAAPAAPALAADCTFQLGFAVLHSLAPDVVGDCLENEHYDATTGNTLQATTRGLMVYRGADNWTAFTDGAWTWLNGPCGLQDRANDQFFTWEVSGLGCALWESAGELPPAPPPPPSPQGQPAPADPPADAASGGCGLPGAVVVPRGIPARLRPAWDVIQRCAEEGPIVLDWYEQADPDLSVASLPAGVYGAYSPRANLVVISAEAASDSAEATAAVLVHELRHAYQFAANLPLDCAEAEADAFIHGTLIWARLTGGGVANPETALQEELNLLLAFYLEFGPDGILDLVLGDPAYQDQCA